MVKLPSSDVIKKIQALYKSNGDARAFLDRAAGRLRDSSASSIDLISRSLGISRGEAVALAKALESAGAGQFVVGRRGSKSRFVWSFSCISLGRIAAGEEAELEAPTNPEPEDEEEELVMNDDQKPQSKLTIADAKRLLAASLGVHESNVEIVIRS
jgi:hypothetical protein